MSPRCSTLLGVVGIVLLASAARAADWPQWRGPNRDGVSKETGLLKQWPAAGPPLVWKVDTLGVGYSAPAVVGERLYILGARGNTEFLLCLNVKDGKEIWSAKLGPTFTFVGNSWGDGPRSSPTVDGDAIYALGGQGELVCIAQAHGKERWRKSMVQDLGGEVNPIGGDPINLLGWGYSWSPLVDGDVVVCQPGGPMGTLAALDKKTGKELWRSKEYKEQASYATPVAAEIDGVRQYVVLTNGGLAGVGAKDGKLLWKYEKKPAYGDVVIPTPVVQGNLVYATVGYGAGCDLVKVESGKATKVYGNKIVKNTLGGVVLLDGHVYGHSEQRGWVCQNFQTGKEVWSERNALGPGSVIYADGHLYCFSEGDGVLALVEAMKDGWKEVSRFEIPDKTKLRKPNGRTWTPPVLANGQLYVRDQELLFRFDVKGKP